MENRPSMTNKKSTESGGRRSMSVPSSDANVFAVHRQESLEHSRWNEHNNPPGASPSVHTVPLSLLIPNSKSSNAGMPARLEGRNNGFSLVFRKKYERLDWRKIAALDLEKIYRSQDVKSLQENLTQLAFFDLEEELKSVELNPQFLKLFQTMQLSLEYLLYVQDHLQREQTSLSSSSAAAISERDEALHQLEEEVGCLRQLVQSSKDELKRRKRMLVAQQEIINSAAKGRYHKCPLCEKAFIERSYLERHFCRRHPDENLATLLSGDRAEPCSIKVDDRLDCNGRVRMLEGLLAEYQKGGLESALRSSASALVADDTVTQRPAVGSSLQLSSNVAHMIPSPSYVVPPDVLEMCNKQQQEIAVLRKSLVDIQTKYCDSEKTFNDLKSEWQSLAASKNEQRKKTPPPSPTFESPNEGMTKDLMDGMERRVADLQETLESRLKNSEEVWKGQLSQIKEDHERDFRKVEVEMQEKLEESQNAHKVEKLKLQKINEEQEKRIKELEDRLNARRGSDEKSGAIKYQQIRVQNHVIKANRWGKPLTARLSAAVDDHPTMISDLKCELTNALDSKLEEYGIQRGTTGVSDRERDAVFNRLRSEHSQLQGKLAKYGAARSTIENHIRDRPPTEYSSTELLDEASKIRIRTRTGRQVVKDENSQKITEITTYNLTPVRSSELALDLAGQLQRPSTGVSKHVTFDDEIHTAPSRPVSAPSSPAESSNSTFPVHHIGSTSLSPHEGKTSKEEKWFSDDEP